MVEVNTACGHKFQQTKQLIITVSICTSGKVFCVENRRRLTDKLISKKLFTPQTPRLVSNC